jgi:hypothetical protein
MTRRATNWLAWSLWAGSLLLTGAGFLLAWLESAAAARDVLGVGYMERGALFDVVGAAIIFSIPFPTVGALIASRQPRNAIGWIFCTVGLLQACNVTGYAYGRYGLLVQPGSLPAAAGIAALSEVAWMPSLALLSTFLLLLFPDGRPPSPRWRWVAWLGGAGLALLLVGAFWAFWTQRGPQMFEVEAEVLGGPFEIFIAVGFVMILLSALASVAALVTRFRRSRGVERQQLKLFTYAGSLAFAVILSAFLPEPIKTPEEALLAVILVPISAGIAILRYRLYDVDLVINRTLVYGSLTALLVGVYAGSVVVLGELLRFGEANDLAVAGSTLAVAALFSPLRRRIQALVDRRFYRSRYDAQRTVKVFASRLREQVDLEDLLGGLTSVVRETLQPASVGVWLADSSLPLRGRIGERVGGAP